MMKNLPLILSLLLLVFTTKAQVQYPGSDYATAQDSFMVTHSYGTNIAGFDFDTTGPGLTWDFSTMGYNTQNMLHIGDNDFPLYKSTFVASCVATCMAAGGTSFACTNSCNTQWNDYSNLSKPTLDSININSVQFSNGVDLLKNTGSALTQNLIAYTAEISGVSIPLVIEYDSTDNIYAFPVTYGTSDSSEFGYAIDLNSYGIPLSYTTNRIRKNYVDGWGTLKTPYGTFANTVRLKTIINRADTIVLDTIKLGQGILQTIKYSWFAPGYGIPVFEAMGNIINGMPVIETAQFYDTVRCLSPSPLFVYSPVEMYLSGSSDSVQVNFYNQSQNSNTFVWDFGDATSGSNNSSTLQNPLHFYHQPGTYAVQLIATNTVCNPVVSDTIVIPVVIIDSTKVNAAFSIIPAYPCAGDSVRFVNTSINNTLSDWTFGDGGVSSLRNPKHLYTTAGTYNVQLIATKVGAPTTRDTVIHTIVVKGPPTVDAGADAFIFQGDSVILSPVASETNLYYLWQPAASLSCAGCINPVAKPLITTTYSVSVYSFCGMGMDSVTVDVSPVTGIKVSGANNALKCYPVPASNVITIEYNLSGNIEFSVFNNLGQKLITFTQASLQKGVYKKTVDVSGLPNGVYFIEAKQNLKTEKNSFVIAR